jgi:hypothetical protein
VSIIYEIPTEWVMDEDVRQQVIRTDWLPLDDEKKCPVEMHEWGLADLFNSEDHPLSRWLWKNYSDHIYRMFGPCMRPPYNPLAWDNGQTNLTFAVLSTLELDQFKQSAIVQWLPPELLNEIAEYIKCRSSNTDHSHVFHEFGTNCSYTATVECKFATDSDLTPHRRTESIFAPYCAVILKAPKNHNDQKWTNPPIPKKHHRIPPPPPPTPPKPMDKQPSKKTLDVKLPPASIGKKPHKASRKT